MEDHPNGSSSIAVDAFTTCGEQEELDKQSVSSTMKPLYVEDSTDSIRNKLPFEHSVHSKLKTIAGISGNVLEWYDFAVFGFFGDISECNMM